MKKMIKNVTIIIATMTLATGVLAGCAKAETDDLDVKATGEKRKIVALTTGSPRPYLWRNEDDSLDGYDIAVFNEIMRRLPQYEFEYEVTEDVFTSADAGYGQVIVQHLGSNDERREKYLFSDPYYFAEHGLLVSEGSEIEAWDDLPGHSTEVQAGSFNSILFEKWNEENSDKKIELVYVDNTNGTPLHVADGTVDFVFFDYISLVEQAEAQGLTDVKILPMDNDTIPNKGTGFTYFVYPKGEEQLQKDVNEAFEAALEEGVINELSQKYLEGDFVPTLDEVLSNR